MKAVILSGGSGLRLWPYSRTRLPKQFLPLFEGRSLLELTATRLSRLCPVADIHVVAPAEHRAAVTAHLRAALGPTVPDMICEPYARNTAPAIALAVKHLLERSKLDPHEAILFCPADHGIDPVATFTAAVQSAARYCEGKGTTVILGVVPRSPETGYGYIETGAQESDSFFQVARFIEKPTPDKARDYCERGGFLWNSGMVVSTAALLTEEFRRHHPALYSCLTEKTFAELPEAFASLTPVSFDYCVLEKTQNLAIKRLALSWNDFGSWESIYDWFPKDGQANVIRGDVQTQDVARSLIWGGEKLVAAFNVRDLVIIDTPDALLVGDRKDTQRVKEIAETLIRTGRREAALPRTLSREWGSATVLCRTETMSIILLNLEPQAALALPPLPCARHLITSVNEARIKLRDTTTAIKAHTSLDIPEETGCILHNPQAECLEVTVICQGTGASTFMETLYE